MFEVDDLVEIEMILAQRLKLYITYQRFLCGGPTTDFTELCCIAVAVPDELWFSWVRLPTSG